MDEKRRMDPQSEVARSREGRSAVRVRLLRVQSDPAPEDHGAGGGMKLNCAAGQARSVVRRTANRMTCTIYRRGWDQTRCLQQMRISVFQQAPILLCYKRTFSCRI